MTPEITEQQKKKFKVEFNKIISQTPDEVQKLWKSNDEIIWLPGNTFMIMSEAQGKLTGKLLHDYVNLINKVKSNTL
ncbi:MAG: hypothetical protein ABIM99_01995 [Candidatus Dojkabacteria bacterium]